ncbi:MAG: RAMP superfamily CRISPR-associated protein [Thiotrichales bacterium]
MQPARMIAEFRVLTPLFLGNAAQEPALRVPGIKGVLRSWYRAVDPEYYSHEARIWGGQGEGYGQAPLWLSLETAKAKAETWEWRANTPGLRYLGFPFGMGRDVPRQAIAVGTSFTLNVLAPRGLDQRTSRAALASIWCLGNLGALGSRARRGFGALALTKWSAEGDGLEELSRLTLLADAEKVEDGLRAIDAARKTFQEWFGGFKDTDGRDIRYPQPHFGSTFVRLLWNKPSAPNAWSDVLDLMGSRLQAYRKTCVVNRRAAFGLPIGFPHRRVGGQQDRLIPVDPRGLEAFERHGSLLFLRPVLIGGRLYPLFLRMAGDVPGEAPRAASHIDRRPIAVSGKNAMDEFLDWLRQGGR